MDDERRYLVITTAVDSDEGPIIIDMLLDVKAETIICVDVGNCDEHKKFLH